MPNNNFNCAYCKKPFYRSPGHAARTKMKFCSHKCSGSYYSGTSNPAYNERESRTCAGCDSSFLCTPKSKRVTCSLICLGKLRTKLGTVSKFCGACDLPIKVAKSISNRENYCDQICADLGHSLRMLGEGNPKWAGGISNKPYPYNWSLAVKNKIRNRDSHTCQMCFRKKIKEEYNFHVHHIDRDKNNLSPLNLITLCPECHLCKVHKKKVELSGKLSKQFAKRAKFLSKSIM